MNRKILIIGGILLILVLIGFSLYSRFKHQTFQTPPSEGGVLNGENKTQENGSIELEKPPFLK